MRKIIWRINKFLNKTIKVSLFDELYWKFRKDFTGDWKQGGYWESKDHPHRKIVLDTLEKEGNAHFTLAEVGSNCGPNLEVIRRKFPYTGLSGLDISKKAVEEGRGRGLDLTEGKADMLPWKDKSYDYVLADAVLMYIGPDKILKVIEEMLRVTKKKVIIIDFHKKNANPLGEVEVGHWVRDYESLFAKYGLQVKVRKITEEEWPGSYSWKKLGYLITVDI